MDFIFRLTSLFSISRENLITIKRLVRTLLSEMLDKILTENENLQRLISSLRLLYLLRQKLCVNS